MQKIKIATLFVSVLAMAACGDPDLTACNSDADCAEGQSCNLDVHQCHQAVVILCEKDCGDGFLCQTLAGKDVCSVEEGKEGVAAIRAPAAGAISHATKIAVSCEAKAPQFGEVRVSVKGPDGETSALTATRRKGTDLFDATFDAEPSSVIDGEYEVGCVLTYGPENSTIETKAAPVKIIIDRTPPKIAIPAITTWQAHSGTTMVKATIVDEGGTATKKAGIDGATVRLTVAGETISGTSGAGDTWTFAVQPAAVTSNSIEGALDFTITASDKVGNEASETSSMNVDASGPTLAMTPPSSWRSRDAAKFSLVAKVTASGAGVSSVTLSGAGGTPSLTGTQAGDDYQFEITPSEWQAAGSEEPVAWTLIAVDEAGNEATLEGTFKLDGKGPTMAANVPDGWGSGVQHDLSVAVSDAASGVDESSVRWSAGGVDGDCTKESAGQYVCNVSLTTAEGSTDDKYEVTLSAEDAVGNASQSNVMLKVDRQGPTVTLHNDGAWYGRGATVTVKATASDVGAGLGGTAVFRTTAPKQSTTSGTLSGNSVTFEVLAADVAPENVTTASITASIQICDAVSNCTEVSANDLFKVDDEAPSITLGNDLAYLSGNGEALRRDPAGGDRAKVTFTATVTDGGAGVAGSDVRLAFTGVDGNPKEIPAKSQNGDVYSFEFDAKDAQFNAGEGDIQLRVVAKDGAGKDAESEAESVLVTRKLWDFKGSSSQVIGALAVDGGRVFYATANNGEDSASDNVFSVNSADGSLAWSAKVTGTPTTPITVGESLLYFGSSIDAGSLHAFSLVQGSKTGVEAWSCSGLGIASGALAYAAEAKWSGQESETIFYATEEPRFRGIRRNASDTACESQSAPLSGLNPGQAAISHAENAVFFGGTEGVISAVELKGDLFAGTGAVSQEPTGISQPIAGVPLDSNGAPFLVHPSFVAKLIPSSPSPMAESYRGTSDVFTMVARAPASLASDTKLYVGTDKGYLLGFDTTTPGPEPKAVLEFAVRNDAGTLRPVASTPAIGERIDGPTTTQTIYFGANDGKFRAITPSGNELWSFTLGGKLESSPALDCRGVAYVGTENGQVVALITDSDRLASSSWPKYQRDNRNTGSLTTPLHEDCDL